MKIEKGMNLPRKPNFTEQKKIKKENKRHNLLCSNYIYQ